LVGPFTALTVPAEIAPMMRRPTAQNILKLPAAIHERDISGTEQKAVAIAPDGLKAYLQKFLVDYQRGKLPDLNAQ
jgi:hypothetical protein